MQLSYNADKSVCSYEFFYFSTTNIYSSFTFNSRLDAITGVILTYFVYVSDIFIFTQKIRNDESIFSQQITYARTAIRSGFSFFFDNGVKVKNYGVNGQ